MAGLKGNNSDIVVKVGADLSQLDTDLRAAKKKISESWADIKSRDVNVKVHLDENLTTNAAKLKELAESLKAIKEAAKDPIAVAVNQTITTTGGGSLEGVGKGSKKRGTSAKPNLPGTEQVAKEEIKAAEVGEAGAKAEVAAAKEELKVEQQITEEKKKQTKTVKAMIGDESLTAEQAGKAGWAAYQKMVASGFATPMAAAYGARKAKLAFKAGHDVIGDDGKMVSYKEGMLERQTGKYYPFKRGKQTPGEQMVAATELSTAMRALVDETAKVQGIKSSDVKFLMPETGGIYDFGNGKLTGNRFGRPQNNFRSIYGGNPLDAIGLNRQQLREHEDNRAKYSELNKYEEMLSRAEIKGQQALRNGYAIPDTAVTANMLNMFRSPSGNVEMARTPYAREMRQRRRAWRKENAYAAYGAAGGFLDRTGRMPLEYKNQQYRNRLNLWSSTMMSAQAIAGASGYPDPATYQKSLSDKIFGNKWLDFKAGFSQWAEQVGNSQMIRGLYRMRDFTRQLQFTGMAMTAGVTAPVMAGIGGTAAVGMGYEKAAMTLRANLFDNFAGNAEGLDAAMSSLLTLANTVSQQSTFTPQEIIEAETEFIRLGNDDIATKKAMVSMTQLAEIENMSLAQSAYIVSSTIHGFGLTADDTSHVINVLAKASADSALTVAQLGHDFAYAASSARQAGWSVEEVAAAMEGMASMGILPERVGFYIRGIADSLNDIYGDKQLRGMSRALGLDLINPLTGQLRDYATIVDNFENLRERLGYDPNAVNEATGTRGMWTNSTGYGRFTQFIDKFFPRDQRTAFLASMDAQIEVTDSLLQNLGKDVITIGNTVYKKGDWIRGGDLQRYNTEILKNAPDDMAKRMSEGAWGSTAGEISQLKSAFMELAVTIAERGLLDDIRNIAKSLKTIVGNISAFVKQNPGVARMAVMFGLMAAAAGPLIMIIGSLLGMVTNLIIVETLMGIAGETAFVGVAGGALGVLGPLAAVAAAVAAIGIGFGALYMSDSGFAKTVNDLFGDILPVFNGLMYISGQLGEGLMALVAAPIAWLLKMVVDFGELFFHLITGIVNLFKGDNAGVVSEFGKAFTEGFIRIGIDTMYEVTQLASGILHLLTVGLWDNLLKVFHDKAGGIYDVFEWLYNVLVGHSIVPDLVNGIIYWFTLIPGGIIKALGALGKTVLTPFQGIIDFFGMLFNPKKLGGLWKKPEEITKAIGGALDAIWSGISNNGFVKFITGLFGGFDLGKMVGGLLKVGTDDNGNLGYTIVQALTGAFDQIWAFVGENPFAKLIMALFHPESLNFEDIAASITEGFTTIKDKIEEALGMFVDLLKGIPGVGGFVTFIQNLFDMITLGESSALLNQFGQFFDALRLAISGFVDDVIKNVPGLDKIVTLIQGMLTISGDAWEAITNPGGSTGTGGGGTGTGDNGGNPVLRPISLSVIRALWMQNMASTLGPGNIDMWRQYATQLGFTPAFATGGVVMKPTIGLIGERGPEAVIPLRDYGVGAGVGGARTANIYVELDSQVIARAVGEPLVNEIRLRTGMM